jgi:transglutaminase-like putative cysteine protease
VTAVADSPPRSLVPLAEAGLTAVTLAVVLGMARLFEGGSWVGPLVANAAAAHLVVTVCRRRGLSLWLTAPVMTIGAFLVASWTSYWSTTAAGLPTGETWSAMGSDLGDAWTLYQDVVAPAPVAPGFVLASAIALWAVAFVADWAAFRLWVPFEATLPAGTLFLFTALLGTDRGRGWSVALYAGTIIGFLLLHRLARQDGSSHWVAERQRSGHRSLLGAGLALGAVAVLAGTALGPSLPGAGEPGVIDPRELRGDDRSRITISPLVDIQSRLVNQSSLEVFRVEATEPSYWRLTSLEQFDGRIWKSSGSYDDAGTQLPGPDDLSVATAPVEQTFEIRSLSTIWLPTAFVPRTFESDTITPILFDEQSSTLIVDRGVDSSDGITYQIVSQSPRVTEADLAGAAGDVPDDVADQNLGLPEDFSPAVQRLAVDVTADAETPYAKARALQDHLRTFTYDLQVENGHDGDAIEQFLFETQRGYCEQFAGAFAAMARSVGLPARVAVGFTQGQEDPARPGTYIVRGEHAHAWPEVYFAGAGWVSFEPTPGRGQPFAEDYTGVTPAQAATGDPGAVVTSPPTTGEQIPTLTTQPGDFRPPSDQLDSVGGESGSGQDEVGPSVADRILRPIAYVVGAAAALAIVYALAFPAFLLIRRRRRQVAATTPLERVAVAWAEAAERARMLGYEEQRSHTFAERAHALAAHVADDGAEGAARRLAHQLELGVYSDEPLDDLAAELAEEASAELQDAARADATLGTRLRFWLDPRPYLRAWRTDRSARQRHITTTVPADREVERELVGTADRA